MTLEGCYMQCNQINKLEVAVKDYTKITPSASTFDVSDLKTTGIQLITLKLSSIKEFDQVICRALVTKQSKSQIVGSGKTKQDVSIKDSTGSAPLTLWQNDIGNLRLGDSYQFKQVVVRTFKGKVNLSLPPNVIEHIDDLSDVPEEDDSDNKGVDEILMGAKMIGVHRLEEVYTCLYCKSGKQSVQTGNIATCELCKTTQGLLASKKTAKLLLEGADITQHVTVRAYQDKLQAAAQNNTLTPETSSQLQSLTQPTLSPTYLTELPDTDLYVSKFLTVLHRTHYTNLFNEGSALNNLLHVQVCKLY